MAYNVPKVLTGLVSASAARPCRVLDGLRAGLSDRHARDATIALLESLRLPHWKLHVAGGEL